LLVLWVGSSGRCVSGWAGWNQCGLFSFVANYCIASDSSKLPLSTVPLSSACGSVPGQLVPLVRLGVGLVCGGWGLGW